MASINPYHPYHPENQYPLAAKVFARGQPEGVFSPIYDRWDALPRSLCRIAISAPV